MKQRHFLINLIGDIKVIHKFWKINAYAVLFKSDKKIFFGCSFISFFNNLLQYFLFHYSQYKKC